MLKKIWIDFETAGLDEHKNGLTQIAFIIEDEDGKVMDMGNFDIKPFEGSTVEPIALKVTNKTFDEVMTYEDEGVVLSMFLEIIGKHISITDKNDNFTVAAYNSQFDVKFLAAWLERHGKNFFHYFNYHSVDPLALLRILRWEGEVNLPSLKLALVYKAVFDEEFEAHDAIADITATKRLYEYLTENYIKFPRRA